jgi:YhcG PDDEXK nuclease domain
VATRLLVLVFYHLKLRCFVVIDLKMGAFKPEYAGKMNFYLSAVDDLLRHADDKPSIGLRREKISLFRTIDRKLKLLVASSTGLAAGLSASTCNHTFQY